MMIWGAACVLAVLVLGTPAAFDAMAEQPGGGHGRRSIGRRAW